MIDLGPYYIDTEQMKGDLKRLANHYGLLVPARKLPANASNALSTVMCIFDNGAGLLSRAGDCRFGEKELTKAMSNPTVMEELARLWPEMTKAEQKFFWGSFPGDVLSGRVQNKIVFWLTDRSVYHKSKAECS